MGQFILRRLLAIPIILFAVNLIGFAYGYYMLYRVDITLLRGPYAQRIGAEAPSFVQLYGEYLRGMLSGDWGTLTNGQAARDAIAHGMLTSLGLVLIALLVSVLVGVFLGWRAAKAEPPHVSGWMTVMATVGLAAPSFYIGALLISLSVIYIIWGWGSEPLLPFQGFGWDAHLILPVLALALRPMMQIGQVTSGLLTDEFGRQYVVTARSFGYSLKRIRQEHAFRPIIAPIALVVSGALRILVAELIIIERLFNIPGVGRLIAGTLIITSEPNPAVIATLLTVLALFFLIADFIASVIAREVDPRLRS
jgi:peptide/nickel transport system permease protein